jgi:uncharacterized OB-fold protein
MTVLTPQTTGIPRPERSALSAPFWEGCLRHQLRYQRCRRCSSALFDPAPLCRNCGSTDLGWELSSGVGTVYSWSIVWRPQAPAFSTPYAVAIVQLDEGYHMITNIIGCTTADVRTGMRVTVEFHDVGDDVHLPYFRPLKGSDGAR